MTKPAANLSVQHLCKEYVSDNETLSILEDVQLTLSSGDNLSIVGPSGSGKSTLLYILGTLDTPTSGSVELDGENPFELSGTDLAVFRNSKIGFVFQDHHLLPQLTVLENVLLPALAFGSASPDSVNRAHELLDAVELTPRKKHLPGQLSGGERQRTAVARALLNRPQLILADEPTGNLDIESSHRVAELLFELPAREAAMLIVVTHNSQLALQARQRMRIESRRLVGY